MRPGPTGLFVSRPDQPEMGLAHRHVPALGVANGKEDAVGTIGDLLGQLDS